MKKYLLPLLMTFILIFPSFSAFAEEMPGEDPTASAPVSTPSVMAETAILMDAESGDILFDKNADKKMYPASITKLMTILLALEHGELTDKLTFSHDAVFSIEFGSAHIAIQEGETLTLEQVLRAIILRSANEASNGVAEYVAGDTAAFAAKMTERAKELGCTTTNFVNANGLHNENHYTSAHDMALIAQELLKHEEYRSMMSDTYYEIPPTDKQPETRYLHGQHQMLNEPSLYYYEDAIGGKTGFTSEAMNTLVTYAERDGMTLIAVVMKCNGAEHYTDTAALFDYGFANYEAVKLFSAADHTKTVQVVEMVKEKPIELGTITAAPAGDVFHTVPKGTTVSDIEVKVNCPETIEAPVKVGDVVGTLTVSLGGKTIKTVDLLAQKDVNALSAEERAEHEKSPVLEILKKLGIGLAILLAAFLLLLCITRTIGYMQYKKRRNRRRRRRSNPNRRTRRR